jgi:hypothetical protein
VLRVLTPGLGLGGAAAAGGGVPGSSSGSGLIDGSVTAVGGSGSVGGSSSSSPHAATASGVSLATTTGPVLPAGGGTEASITSGATAAAAVSGVGGGGGSAGGHRHPAFAIEQKGAWHALTLSAAQQVIGPVRFRGDWRFALDSQAACPKGLMSVVDPRAHLQLLRHVGGMRPSLVESAYGVDVVVPGSSGAARIVAWWSPGRREGMLELRLL